MKPDRKGKSGKNKSVTYGWCGEWNDGTLGWMLSDYLTTYPQELHFDGERAIRCNGRKFHRVKITVEKCFDKRGRAISKTYRRKP